MNNGVVRMANNLFRELNFILSEFTDSLFAGALMDEICDMLDIPEDDITAYDLPRFLLTLATHQKLLDRQNASEFSKMMKKFIALSNHHITMDRSRIRTIVNDYKDQKTTTNSLIGLRERLKRS